MEKKAYSYGQEAERVMQKHGWSEDDVPDAFPELAEAPGPQQRLAADGTKTASEIDTAVNARGQFGPLSYRVIAPKEWINIEANDGSCARVLVAERKVTSDDIRIISLEGEQFECQEWGLAIRWISNNEVQFRLGTTECNIRIG